MTIRLLENLGDRAVWVEVSRISSHGGQGWEFGKCLWSPVRNVSGQRRYQIMESVQAQDCVLHFRTDENQQLELRGSSVASGAAIRLKSAPPDAGPWAGRDEYYRIDLHGYEDFETRVPLAVLLKRYADEILDELRFDNPRFYPITTHGDSLRTVQGIYLARCTPRLLQTLMTALGLQEQARSQEEAELAHAEFQEHRYRIRESTAFSRNPRLIAAAKARAAGACEACGLDTHRVHRDYGVRVLECHHIDPLSERPTQLTHTSLDEVIVLCANCHRLAHSQSPPVNPSELRSWVRRND